MTEDLAAQLVRLQRENAKLSKINQVLMDRVERNMDFQGNAFSLFQTAIVLESKVRERTSELEAALVELERSNHALSLAKAQEETAKSRLGEAIESISEGFVLTDAEDRLVLFNSKYRELWPTGTSFLALGTPFSDVVRNAIYAGELIESQNAPDQLLARRMESHTNPNEPFVLQFRSGRWVQVNERRTVDGGIVGIYTDITEIKASERRLRERELAKKSALLQATLDNLSQGVSVFDANQRLAAWNERFVELLGLPPELASADRRLNDFLMSPAIRSQFPLADDGSLDLGHQVEEMVFEMKCVTGRVLEIRRHAMPDGGFVTTYSDMTERKASEEALRDSERRIRLVTDAMPALIAYVDADEYYQFTNKAYEDWFGRPRSEIDGQLMKSVLGAPLYNQRQDYVEMALAGEKCTFEMSLPKGDGRMQHALATYVPHVDYSGKVLGFFALIQDITDRKRAADQLREANENLERRVVERTAELQATNAALGQAKAEAEQANLSKTKFLAAASHDLLQPLNAARVFAAALTERRLSNNNRMLADNTLAALESVDEILNALLDISKLDAGVLPAEINDFAVNNLLTSMRGEHELMMKAAKLDFKVMPCSCAVRSDHRLLSRILRNLISNAIRYTQTGRILVGCRKSQGKVLIGVWDSGIGVPEDKLEEIFQEFHRLQAGGRDKGMGLGLAIVQRIARKLDHRLVVRSKLGVGSFFGIEVPLGDHAAARVREVMPAAPPLDALAGALVFMIDNDTSILRGMTALLTGWNCKVLVAASVAEADDVARSDGRRPDIIIADYHLDDNVIGLDAIQVIQDTFGSGIPALVITANHTPEVQADVKSAGYHLLNKPVKPARLRSLMAHLLAGK